MRIQLLGTGAAEGWPGMFCRCGACGRALAAGGKNLRSRSSALIDGVLLLDLTPDIQHHVLTHGLELGYLRYIVLTHGHDDHLAATQLQYMSRMFIPHTFDPPIRILGPKEAIAAIRASVDPDDLPIELTCVQPGDTVKVPPYTITPIAARHDPSMVCVNYLIGSEGRTVLYATDLGGYDEDAWACLEGARIDCVIVECTKGPVTGGYSGHMGIAEVVSMRDRLLKSGAMLPETPVVTTHHSHQGGLLHEELEARLNPYGIRVGYDGMRIEV